MLEGRPQEGQEFGGRRMADRPVLPSRCMADGGRGVHGKSLGTCYRDVHKRAQRGGQQRTRKRQEAATDGTVAVAMEAYDDI